tara:strand:- start:128 stop:310 length:183 start_codon:yes stop_codon:yes gene_type:complete
MDLVGRSKYSSLLAINIREFFLLEVFSDISLSKSEKTIKHMSKKQFYDFSLMIDNRGILL